MTQKILYRGDGMLGMIIFVVLINLAIGLLNFSLVNIKAKKTENMSQMMKDTVTELQDTDEDAGFFTKIFKFYFKLCFTHPYLALLLLILFYSIPIFNACLLGILARDLRGNN